MSVKPARILDIAEVAEGTYYLKVGPVLGLDEAKPFNFFMVWIPRVDEIPLSIAYRDKEGYSFLFKVKGAGTKALSRLRPGMFIGLRGPLGRGLTIVNELRSALVVAGGIGIAPIPFFIRHAEHAKIDVVWGVRKGSELFDLLALFPEIRGRFGLTVATEDCSTGVCGTVLDALRHADLKGYDVLIAVGPTAMLKEVCKYSKAYGRVSAYVALETIVKCGVGLCGSCYIKHINKLLCVDGPVFRCEEVEAHLGESLDSKSV